MNDSVVNYGFSATMAAKPGRGDDLIALLLSGLDAGKPATSEHCLVYLVSRSASNPDLVHVIEGWTTEEDHHRCNRPCPADPSHRTADLGRRKRVAHRDRMAADGYMILDPQQPPS